MLTGNRWVVGQKGTDRRHGWTDSSVRIIISENAEVTSGFLPNIVRLRRVDARVVAARGREHVKISRRVGDLFSVCVPRRHQAVDIRSCWAPGNLVWCTGITRGLGPVVIFQFDIEDSTD